MCLKTICEDPRESAPDPFATAYEIWSRLSDAWDAAYYAQEKANVWNEAVTNELGAIAEAAFDKALETVPLTIRGLNLYISMLLKRKSTECPEAMDVALATLAQAIDQLSAHSP